MILVIKFDKINLGDDDDGIRGNSLVFSSSRELWKSGENIVASSGQ